MPVIIVFSPLRFFHGKRGKMYLLIVEAPSVMYTYTEGRVAR